MGMRPGRRFCNFSTLILLVVACTVGGHETALGQLHWPGGSPRQQRIRLRVVGRVMALPRTSFFASHEVFVAEKALNREEGTLIKLVYEFLPYQPSLSEIGMDYSTIYDVRATRDPQCDESLTDMMSSRDPKHDRIDSAGFKYATDAPELAIPRHRSSLPCYESSAEDFGRAERAPLHTDNPEPMPRLKVER
jgi:hypothetical protein